MEEVVYFETAVIFCLHYQDETVQNIMWYFYARSVSALTKRVGYNEKKRLHVMPSNQFTVIDCSQREKYFALHDMTFVAVCLA